MLATKRAMMISRNLNLLKIHRLGIECQQLIGQQLTHARQNFNVSAAWIVPSMPAIAPKTPACEQAGTSPGGGGAPYRQR